MNLFNETNKKSNSYLLSSAAFRTCTPCCPFDTKNLPHPQINQPDINVNEITSNSDACCLSKLQVDCRIQCHKKKKKHKKLMKNKRYDSVHSSSSTKRSRFDSSTNINSHYMHDYDLTSSSSSSSTNESELTEQSEREYRYQNKSANAHQQSQSQLQISQTIQDLKTSIDNLTQLIIPNQSISFLDKLRRFFTSFKSPSKDQINEECCQILERNHLTKQNLLSIYQLFDKNETIFLNWLRTIMPEYFLPLLLNYVKHFDSISTDNE